VKLRTSPPLLNMDGMNGLSTVTPLQVFQSPTYNWKGRANANPMLDSRTYEIEFPDGSSDEYTANVIAENMYAQCDTDGNHFIIMDCIIDHKKDGHALERADMYIKNVKNKQVRKTTKGWNL
jgi:hypothetical protein